MLTNPSWNSLHSRKDTFFNWKRINYNNHVYSHFMCCWKETIVEWLRDGSYCTAGPGWGQKYPCIVTSPCLKLCVCIFFLNRSIIRTQGCIVYLLQICGCVQWRFSASTVCSMFFKKIPSCVLLFERSTIHDGDGEVFRACLCENQKNTIYPHAVNSRASRECTASVRRWHGELGVLIKFFTSLHVLFICKTMDLNRLGCRGSLNSCLLWNKPQS